MREAGGRRGTHHQERLHLVLVLDRHLVHVQNACVPTGLDPAVLLDGLENLPAPLPILRVAREAERDEERLHRLGAAK